MATRGLMQNDLFDVSEIVQTNEQIKKEEHQRKNLEARKNLKLLHYEHPKNQNEELMNYQYEFLINNSQIAWGKLITLSFEVTKKLVWKAVREQSLPLDEIDVEERTSIAVEYILRRYQTRIGYCVQKNYIYALNQAVCHALHYITKLDSNTSYLEDSVKEHSKDYGDYTND